MEEENTEHLLNNIAESHINMEAEKGSKFSPKQKNKK